MRQQAALEIEAARVATELAVRGDHAVAGNHDGQRIASVGGADGAGVTVTDSTLRVVYREVSPDLPVSDGAFGGRARLAMIHHADRRTLEVTTTRGARSSTTTIANIERVRFRAHDGEDWTSEFDSRAAKRLPSAVEVAVWFARPGGGTGVEEDAGASEMREWREPDRLRVIAVFDSSADESIDAVAEEGDARSVSVLSTVQGRSWPSVAALRVRRMSTASPGCNGFDSPMSMR